MDAYSAHDYFSAIEAPGRELSGGVMQPFLRGYEGTVTGLGGKTVFIGEFGCNRTDGDASYRGTLGGAELVIGGLNAGVRGFARWAYNHADSGKDDGFNPFTSVNGKLQPKPAVYYGYAVLTKAIKAGMQVATTDVQGGKDADGTQRVHAATLTGAGGAFTIVLVNDGRESKTIHLIGSQRPRLYHLVRFHPPGRPAARRRSRPWRNHRRPETLQHQRLHLLAMGPPETVICRRSDWYARSRHISLLLAHVAALNALVERIGGGKDSCKIHTLCRNRLARLLLAFILR